MKKLLIATMLFTGCFAMAQSSKFEKDYSAVESKVIEWRRDFHQNPELGNREFKTAAKIAKHLKSLGIEVQTGVAHTGVVGIFKRKQTGQGSSFTRRY